VNACRNGGGIFKKNNSFRIFAAQKSTSLREGGYYSFRIFAAQKSTSLREGGYYSFRLFATQKSTSLGEGGYYSFHHFEGPQRSTASHYASLQANLPSLKEGGYAGELFAANEIRENAAL